MKPFLLALLIVSQTTLHAATWYVRADGGTRYSTTGKAGGQCDGLADVPYPGTGTNQHCAFSDFRMLFSDGAYATAAGPHWSWVIAGGDTVILDCPNSCRVGYENGATSNGSVNAQGYAVALAGNPYGSGAPPPPSGTASQHTRILGRNYASCQDDSLKAAINGGFGVNPVIALNGVAYVDLACLNISDKSDCTRGSQNQCKTSYPLDDYATSGISTSNTTTNTTLTDIRIHGMAANGMIGATGDGVALQRVVLAGNPSSGWNMDAGNGQTGTGNLTLDHFQVLWSGCEEEYPIVDTVPYHWCTDQNSGGYGDGLSTATATSNPAWHVTITNSVAAYNTQDGFDLLHLEGNGSTLTVTGSQMYSNMGQQLKVGSQSASYNNLIVGNCNALRQAIPGTPTGYNTSLSLFCRAADTSIALAVADGAPTYFAFNTMYSAGLTNLQITCGAATCTSASSLIYEDNIFLGFQNSAANGYPGSVTNDYSNPIYLDPGVSTLFSNPGTKYDHNSTWHWKSNWACPQAKWNEQAALCVDPQLKDETWHNYGIGDMTVLAGSPVIAAGVAIAQVTTDYAGTLRPTPPAIGAYELVPPPVSYMVIVNNIGSGSADNCRGTYAAGQPFNCVLTNSAQLISISGCGGSLAVGSGTYSGTATASCSITAQYAWLDVATVQAQQSLFWVRILVILLLLLVLAVFGLWWFKWRDRKPKA